VYGVDGKRLRVVIKSFGMIGQTKPAVFEFKSNVSLRRLNVIRDKILLNSVVRLIVIDSETRGGLGHRCSR